MIFFTIPNTQTEPINKIVKFSDIIAPSGYSSLVTEDFYQQYRAPYLACIVGVSCVSDIPSLDEGGVIFQNIDALGGRSKMILGENGVSRYSKFETYEPGWDGENAKPLSHRSVAVMEYFLELYNDFPTTPSIFLMESGNLQLGWEDKFHKTIEVEFAPDQLVYFIESLGVEGEATIDSTELSELLMEIQELSI